MVVAAKRREIEPVSFPDIYMAMVERPDGILPKGDGTVMMASIRTPEHAGRCMELIVRHVAAKREQGTLELDWPVRKKWLERICKLALRMRTPQIVVDIFSNGEKFALSTYFAADMVEQLGAMGAEANLLQMLVERFRLNRQPGCKGVQSAYLRLAEVMRGRKEEAGAKAAREALKKYMEAAKGAAVQAAAKPAPAAA